MLDAQQHQSRICPQPLFQCPTALFQGDVSENEIPVAQDRLQRGTLAEFNGDSLKNTKSKKIFNDIQYPGLLNERGIAVMQDWNSSLTVDIFVQEREAEALWHTNIV